MGMITPIWEQREHLPNGIRTRFRLRYSMSEGNTSETFRHVWAQLEAQHASLLFALRKLKKISIDFQDIDGRNCTMSFEKSFFEDSSITKITKSVAGNETGHFYRTFAINVGNMPKHFERSRAVSSIKIGFPVTARTDGIPILEVDGQLVLAWLPVMQIPQLPFIIQADFLLTGSRQSVIDNSRNRRLRDGVAELFAVAAKKIVLEKSELSYEWLAFIPRHMNDFWRTLPGLIHQRLSAQKLLYARDESLYESRSLRIPIQSFMHGKKPLLPASGCSWRFLLPRYRDTLTPTLKALGVTFCRFQMRWTLCTPTRRLPTRTIRRLTLSDRWHRSLLSFIQAALGQSSSTQYKDQIREMFIAPVRVQNELEWRRPWGKIYHPIVVESGVGSEAVEIEMPMDVDLVVLYLNALKIPSGWKVYKSLGVCNCPAPKLCVAIEQAQRAPGKKLVADMIRHFELMFWFSHDISYS